MQTLLALPSFYIFLLGVTLFYNTPLLLIVLASRRRMPRVAAQVVVAAGFAAAAGYMIWRMEWFDVWRHGQPSIGYLLRAFVPETAAIALTGWGLAGLIVPRAHASRPRDASRPAVEPVDTLC